MQKWSIWLLIKINNEGHKHRFKCNFIFQKLLFFVIWLSSVEIQTFRIVDSVFKKNGKIIKFKAFFCKALKRCCLSSYHLWRLHIYSDAYHSIQIKIFLKTFFFQNCIQVKNCRHPHKINFSLYSKVMERKGK